jgi:hypothetical protein
VFLDGRSNDLVEPGPDTRRVLDHEKGEGAGWSVVVYSLGGPGSHVRDSTKRGGPNSN